MRTLEAQALAQHLDESLTWRSLLHADLNRSQINDPGFVLSSLNFSFKNELLATLNYLYNGPAEHVCRFPARYWWLRHQINAPDLPLNFCPGLQEFLVKAPADEISLIFASENLAQPSSMMGHLFLKLSGPDAQGQVQEHAVTFFTDAATINLPKLLFDSLVLGKRGYFALSPYQDQVDQYVTKEGRGLWQYKLKLDRFTLELIRLHIYELKQTEFLYFFQRYNCATLVNFIVSLAGASMLDGADYWLTPQDVIKRAGQAGLIEDSTVVAPDVWLIRLLDAEQSWQVASVVRDDVARRRLPQVPDDADRSVGYERAELALAYNQYLVDEKIRSPAEGRSYAAAVQADKNARYPDLSLEAGRFKNPLNTPQDTQIGAGLLFQDGQPYAQLTFLPVSHALADDNASYLSENELKLFEVSVLRRLDGRGGLRLDHLDIYAIGSFLPFDPLVGGLSGKFKIGVAPQLGRDGVFRQSAYVEGGLGATWRATRDMDVYGIFNLGGAARAGVNAYAGPEIGLLVREVFNMKSLLSVQRQWRQEASNGGIWDVSLTQSKYLSASQSVVVNARRQFDGCHARQSVSLAWKQIF